MARENVAYGRCRKHDEQPNDQGDPHAPFAPTKQTSRQAEAAPTATGFASQRAKKNQPYERCNGPCTLVVRKFGATPGTKMVTGLGGG
jgi:hypothetical protein